MLSQLSGMTSAAMPPGTTGARIRSRAVVGVVGLAHVAMDHRHRARLALSREVQMRAYTAVMSDPNGATRATAGPILRALRRTRQVRQFTNEPVTETDLSAILEVARWSGSSMNVHG